MRVPVFLHCGWRTAGTWIWSQFRTHGDVMAFYEPLHESLGTLTLRTMPAMRPGKTNSRHPDPQRPYFEEFAPLLAPGIPGVAGYRQAFAYDGFFAESGDDVQGLAGYLRSLVRLAQAHGKTPAFKFCRSLGRAGWMSRAFPEAAHILVLREPWGQWRSAWRIFAEERNPYFLMTPLRILAQCRGDRVVAFLLHRLDVRAGDCEFPAKHAASCRAVAATPPEALYRAFLVFWMSTAFSARSSIDFTVESDRLGCAAYRAEVERRIETKTGFSIDLRAYRPLLRPIGPLSAGDLARIHGDAFDAAGALTQFGGGRCSEAIALLQTKLAATGVLARKSA